MCFSFQFAKHLLEGTSVAAELDPGFEGGKIAAEVLDASDSLREVCSKCGQQLTGGERATHHLHGYLPTPPKLSL